MPLTYPLSSAHPAQALWGADIVRRFFTALAKVGAKATAGPLFRANGDASGPSCPVLVWGTQVSGGNTTIST